MLCRRLVSRGLQFLPRVSSVRSQSSYEQGASHSLLGEQSSNVVEIPYYNEKQVREWLAKYPGGSVSLSKNEETGFATILVQNDGKKNAFTGSMMQQLGECVHSLQDWHNGKAVVLMGANGDFCSGGDLGFMEAIATPKLGCRMSIFMQEITSNLYRLPLLTVALIQGNALGGGAELSMACDLRVFGGGERTAKLGFVQSSYPIPTIPLGLGVTTGWGGGTHLVRLIGPKAAFRLLVSGKVLEAEEAVRAGVVDHVIPEADPAKLEAELQKWLNTNYLRGQATSMKAMKRMVFNVNECNYAEALNRERDIFMRLWGAPAHKASMEEVKKKLRK